MTSEQEAQLRAILEIEGAPVEAINATIENTRRNPEESSKWLAFMATWKLVTKRSN